MKPHFMIGAFALMASVNGYADHGKLLATAGLTQVEGSGGGGIVPWATISGYESQDDFSAAVFSTQVTVDDYRLNALGLSVGLYDRVELSYAQQTFFLTTAKADIKQVVYGAKVKIFGDIVYTNWPQVSVGLQHKVLDDGAIATAVGADNANSGTDLYVSATKVHLGLVNGYNMVWNLTGRATKANQLGLLGYGGVQNDDYELMLETSVGVLLSRYIAVGVEYRQKPDNLGIKEDDWIDYFVSYTPNKHFNVTLAWAKLGEIAGAQDQDGLFLSTTGYLW